MTQSKAFSVSFSIVTVTLLVTSPAQEQVQCDISLPHFCPLCSRVHPRASRTSSAVTGAALSPVCSQFLCKALGYPRVDVFGMLLLGMQPPPFCPVGFSQVSVSCGQDLLPTTRLFCSCHRAPEICLFLLNKPKTHKVPL